MKQYTKPSVEVVELTVKENIAGLPDAIAGGAVTQHTLSSGQNLILTTYNLAAASTSENA